VLKKPKRGAYRRARKREKKHTHAQAVATVRPAIFTASGGWCVCCRIRRAESMHEVLPRSRGGKVSIANSIPVCGSGTTKCHGFLQRNAITATAKPEHLVEPIAAWGFTFMATTDAAARWLRTA
jgi:hypothetical protein